MIVQLLFRRHRMYLLLILAAFLISSPLIPAPGYTNMPERVGCFQGSPQNLDGDIPWNLPGKSLTLNAVYPEIPVILTGVAGNRPDRAFSIPAPALTGHPFSSMLSGTVAPPGSAPDTGGMEGYRWLMLSAREWVPLIARPYARWQCRYCLSLQAPGSVEERRARSFLLVSQDLSISSLQNLKNPNPTVFPASDSHVNSSLQKGYPWKQLHEETPFLLLDDAGIMVPQDSGDAHTPRGALWRAAAIPGWGQLYNRQYFKIPFVYAGIGGMVWFALYLNDRYLLYRHAYQYKAWDEILQSGQENPAQKYKQDYDRLLERFNVDQISANTLEQQRDIFRRNRDLSYFGIGLVYGLTILDAYVSAHLMDFDVGEDLTLRIVPRGKSIHTALSYIF